jgi:hypothetical protein
MSRNWDYRRHRNGILNPRLTLTCFQGQLTCHWHNSNVYTRCHYLETERSHVKESFEYTGLTAVRLHTLHWQPLAKQRVYTHRTVSAGRDGTAVTRTHAASQSEHPLYTSMLNNYEQLRQMLFDRTSCNSERQTGITFNLWGRIVQTP